MPRFKNIDITLLGNTVNVNEKAPTFTVIDQELNSVTLEHFKGKRKLISVIPSIDTGVCDFQTRKFNEEASKLNNTVVITISCDLPFALKKWCGANGLDVVTLSDHKDLSFGLAYGVAIEEFRLLNRSIFILDENDNIIYKEILDENSNHPDYVKAIEVLQN